jgi:hypothetical protein
VRRLADDENRHVVHTDPDELRRLLDALDSTA